MPLKPSIPHDHKPGRVLKIALLGTRGIPASYGGFETFAQQLAVRLVQRGHQVTVYAEATTQGVPDTWFEGVRVRHVQRPAWGPASVIAYDCRCLADAASGYDLVYMLGYGAAWACWWTRKVRGQIVWLNVDGLEWARSKWGRIARLYLRTMEWVASWSPSRVLADAQAIADRYMQLYPQAVPCSFIAYGAQLPTSTACPAAVLTRWSLRENEYILVVARPEPENHVLEIVQGYQRWGGDWPLVVVGNVRPVTPYQKALLAFASERVRFIGGVYDPDVLMGLRMGAGCHVHGHSVGGTNPSLLEALACGNVVVAHDNIFNREVARDAAQYFASSDQLAQVLAHVHDLDPETRLTLATRARAIVERHYAWEHITTQYETLMLADCAHTAAKAGH